MTPESTQPTPVHRPVLLDEVIAWLSPREGSVIVDGTAGAGGHLAAIARLVGSDGQAIGLDRDPRMLALAEAATQGLPVTLVKAPYSDMLRVLDQLDIDRVDGILLDLGPLLRPDRLDRPRIQLRRRWPPRHAV